MKQIGTGKTWLAVVLCGTMMWTACSTAWITEAEQIVAALIPATANLVALVATLQGKTVSAADLQTIQSAGSQAGADLQLMQSLITQYEKADAAAQPGLLNQIQAAMSAVQATLNGLLPALHITDAATQAKITAVVGILLSEVESVAAIVPLVNASASPAMMTLAAKQVKKQAPLTASKFVSSYNATMTAKTGNAELDHATAGMKIHVHGKVARWASAGILK
jgi:soluble cytochrome b562